MAHVNLEGTTITDHLAPLRERVLNASVEPPPPPWARVAQLAVGGLTEVGFDRTSRWLLLVSSQGRGVIDTTSGELIARDSAEPDDAWYDEFALTALGIGPCAREPIRLSGLHGGGLCTLTRDGWTVENLALRWPDQFLLLISSWQSLYAGGQFFKVAVEREVRAFGFSPDGKILVLATSSDVVIWKTP